MKTSKIKKWSQEKTKEANRMVKVDSFLYTCPLCAYIKKTNTFTFWFMVITLGPHSITPSEGPKTFKTDYLRTRTMEVELWTWTIEEGPLLGCDFMVHSVNRPWLSTHKPTKLNQYVLHDVSTLYRMHVLDIRIHINHLCIKLNTDFNVVATQFQEWH